MPAYTMMVTTRTTVFASDDEHAKRMDRDLALRELDARSVDTIVTLLEDRRVIETKTLGDIRVAD